jgi:hypothetical protein
MLSDILIVILMVLLAILLLPITFWTVRFLWSVIVLYFKIGLTIYAQIFKELGPIWGTMIGMFLLFLYLSFAGAGIYLFYKEGCEFFISGFSFLIGNFHSFRFFWQFLIVGIFYMVVHRYCKSIYWDFRNNR